jgi:flagellin-like protein
MKKLLKSKKALSPVVAAIILIAVTVAVSIAVAAWMGALTFTFMKTEELKITGVTFGNNTAVIACTNTGADALSVSSVTVDDSPATVTGTTGFTGTGPYDLAKGASGTLTISLSWTSGSKYEFAVLTSSGNKYPYSTTATS